MAKHRRRIDAGDATGAGVDVATADMGTYYQAVGLQWTSSTWTTTGNVTAPDIRLSARGRSLNCGCTIEPGGHA
jgi:hypothetical protein